LQRVLSCIIRKKQQKKGVIPRFLNRPKCERTPRLSQRGGGREREGSREI